MIFNMILVNVNVLPATKSTRSRLQASWKCLHGAHTQCVNTHARHNFPYGPEMLPSFSSASSLLASWQEGQPACCASEATATWRFKNFALYCNNICLSSRNVLFQTVDKENYGETSYLRFKGKMVIRMFSNTWIYRSIIHRMKQITLAQKPIRQQSKCNHMIDPKRTPLSVNQWLTFDLLTVLNLKKM